MKKVHKGLLILYVAMLLFVCSIQAQSYDLGAKVDSLLPYIAEVESRCQPFAIGDGGKALGVFQIHAIYVKDYNRIFGANFEHTDVLCYYTAKHITRSIMMYYGRVYYLETNCLPSADVLLSIHNGGGRGWTKNTKSYLKKFI